MIIPLHIWRRGEFMISLSNEDRMFTDNLFAFFHVFKKLTTRELFHRFFCIAMIVLLYSK